VGWKKTPIMRLIRQCVNCRPWLGRRCRPRLRVPRARGSAGGQCGMQAGDCPPLPTRCPYRVGATGGLFVTMGRLAVKLCSRMHPRDRQNGKGGCACGASGAHACAPSVSSQRKVISAA
jgi:hypothetical protein